MSDTVARLLSWLAAAALLAAPMTTHAQEVPCAGSAAEGGLPCGFEIRDLALEQVPTLFELQARIAQAKLPVADHTFQTVVVKALAGDELVCLEELTGVEVVGSVLNLTIGQNMDCDLARIVAERPNLAFQVCLDGAAQCLKPIELSTAPYAIKASWASLAQEAQEAQVAGQANYAQRATADRDMLIRRMIGAGYFDFATPSTSAASDVYPLAAQFAAFSDGGFVQWSPVRDPDARTLHVSSKDKGTDELVALDELVLAADLTVARGDLTVSPAEDGDGLTVAADGLHVTGDVAFGDALVVTGALRTDGAATVHEDAGVAGAVTVDGDVTVTGGGADVTGASELDATLGVDGLLEVLGGIEVLGDLGLDGTLVASAVKVTGGLAVAGAMTAGALLAGIVQVAGLVTAAAIDLGGLTQVGGDLTVGGTLTVTGPAVFHGHVVFEGGSGGDEGVVDPTYVLAEGETRDLAFGGAVALQQGGGLGGPLDLQNHQLLGYRMEASAGPPAACGAATEGALYLDTIEQNLVVCAGGAWVELGGDECGNAFVEPSEACDDGNTAPDDGCDAACALEAPGWDCTPVGIQPTVCEGICGDGWPRGTETCDDGALLPGDGCDAGCQIEQGWACEGEPSECATVCGDGLLTDTEACDDGDEEPGDGCDAGCVVESGWSCEGEPSVCTYGVCGDGLILTDIGETCDDGNDQGGDGCSATCQVEANSTCVGEPSACVVHGSQSWSADWYTCIAHTWVVPPNVTEIDVQLQGASGGGNGGNGAYVTGVVSVTPGELLVVQAGSGGGHLGYASAGTCGGGEGGGGDYSSTEGWGAGGGGYAAVFTGAASQASVLLLAGAGGGGAAAYKYGSTSGSYGGSSGSGWGGSTAPPSGTGAGSPGWGGQWNSGGAAGGGHCGGSAPFVQQTTAPEAGSALQGGRGGQDYGGDLNCLTNARGGGGGGGYYGGGGGAGSTWGSQTGGAAGGGGGASFFDGDRVSGAQVVTASAWDGWVTIQW